MDNLVHYRWFTSTAPKYANWELNLVGSGKIFYLEIMNNDKSIHQFNIAKHFTDAEINFEYIKNRMQYNQDINLKDFSDFKNNKLNIKEE